MRHVLVMTATGAVGLISVFFVDFLSLLYISRLGDTNLTAAVGYASQMLFLLISVNIGLSIAIGALVSRALGAGDRARARRLAASGLVLIALVSGSLSLVAMPFTHEIMRLFGARGETLAVGSIYLRMTLPATIFLGIGMGFSSVLRGVGDAKRSMYVTLGGALVTACLDRSSSSYYISASMARGSCWCCPASACWWSAGGAPCACTTSSIGRVSRRSGRTRRRCCASPARRS